MVFYIQDGWPVYSQDFAVLDAQKTIAAIDKQHAGIRRTFESLHAALEAKYPGKVHVIPCSDGVVSILRMYLEGKLPQFDCVSEHVGGNKGIYRDGGHLSSNSGIEYLAGYIYYGMLYQRSPELIEGFVPRHRMPAELDRLYRKIAWQSVTQSPLSGIKDQNGDGIADKAE
jgi:hypothetical protein